MSYVINHGIKKGRYVIELSPIKKALSSDPNIITLTINGVQLDAIKPKLEVEPNRINSVHNLDSLNP